MSPTKQARGNRGKEPKLHRWHNGDKKPWEKPGSVGGPVLLWPDEPAICTEDSSGSRGSYPDGHLGDEVFTGDLSLGSSSCPDIRWHSGL